jgi:hemolysin III
MAQPEIAFPVYSDPERAADRLVHIVGLAAAVLAIAWLLSRLGPAAATRRIVAVIAYSLGLIGMLSASAGYNLVRDNRAKAVLRRLDHAMIFVMIAGTYTPVALLAFARPAGVELCALIWTLAALGIVLRLAWPNRFESVCLGLYLGMGWVILFYIRQLLALPGHVALLLVAGGTVYSLGSLLHAHAGVKYHNPIWHVLVLVAASLHLVAIATLLGPV